MCGIVGVSGRGWVIVVMGTAGSVERGPAPEARSMNMLFGGMWHWTLFFFGTFSHGGNVLCGDQSCAALHFLRMFSSSGAEKVSDTEVCCIACNVTWTWRPAEIIAEVVCGVQQWTAARVAKHRLPQALDQLGRWR